MKKSINKLIIRGIIASSICLLPVTGVHAESKIDNNGVWNQNTITNINNSTNTTTNNTLVNNGQIINNTNNITLINQGNENLTNNKNNIKTVKDLENHLNANCSTLSTPIGLLKFKFTIDQDSLGVSDYNYWVQTDFGEISNSPYNITFFSPYLLEYSTKISDEDKEKTKLLLRNYQKIIGEAFIRGCNGEKIMGGFYTGFYKYPNSKVGYESTKFLTWKNYDDSGNLTSFHWDTLIDDYDFTK